MAYMGYTGQILEVNLGMSGFIRKAIDPNDFRRFLGGMGLA